MWLTRPLEFVFRPTAGPLSTSRAQSTRPPRSRTRGTTRSTAESSSLSTRRPRPSAEAAAARLARKKAARNEEAKAGNLVPSGNVLPGYSGTQEKRARARARKRERRRVVPRRRSGARMQGTRIEARAREAASREPVHALNPVPPWRWRSAKTSPSFPARGRRSSSSVLSTRLCLVCQLQRTLDPVLRPEGRHAIGDKLSFCPEC
ncbi:hypothetical protein L227DRAFT_20628 [Lentinus tigrinus ALCF2SS1-6]|uniref:Uncharacterized protein n=1 Tax=Lentinus tigrinus ALCF2SS1-6 TaxID=1328759 RepID=A0A5C2STQ4_9APHY|nr:hypothetical protein L227DRAFT_20628 [Lentinus tigrinus ALCF2SS1-6]